MRFTISGRVGQFGAKKELAVRIKAPCFFFFELEPVSIFAPIKCPCRFRDNPVTVFFEVRKTVK